MLSGGLYHGMYHTKGNNNNTEYTEYKVHCKVLRTKSILYVTLI